MKSPKAEKELLFYFEKLPSLKKTEVLDYVKWLWVSPDEKYTEEELDKLEKLAKEKGGKTFKTGAAFIKHLEKISKK